MVQQAAHNPRIKLQVPLAKGLSSVISYLESKWATKQSEKHLCLLVPPAMPPSNEMTASKSTEIEVDCAGQLEKREWTKTSAGNVTVGDVFKCLGRPKKFCLSYTWIDKKQEVFESKPFPALTHLIDLLVAAGQEQEARVASSSCPVIQPCAATVAPAGTENTPPTSHSVTLPTLGVKRNLLHRLNSADESRLDVTPQTGSVIQLQTGNTFVQPAIVVTENQNQPTLMPRNASTFKPITSQTTVLSQSIPVSMATPVSWPSSTSTVAFVVPSTVPRPSDVGLMPVIQVAGVGVDPACKKLRLDPSAIRIMSPTGMMKMMAYTQPEMVLSKSDDNGKRPHAVSSTATKGRRAVRFNAKTPTIASRQKPLLVKTTATLPGQGHFTVPASKPSTIPSTARVRLIAPKTTASTAATSTSKLSVVQRAMQVANIIPIESPPSVVTTVTEVAVPANSVTSISGQRDLQPNPSDEFVQSQIMTQPSVSHVTQPLISTSTCMSVPTPRPLTPPPMTSSPTSLALDLLLTPPSKVISSTNDSHNDLVSTLPADDLLEFPAHENPEGFIADVTNSDSLDTEKSLDPSALLNALSSVPLEEEESQMAQGHAVTPSKVTDFQWPNENSISGLLAQSPYKDPGLVDGREISMVFRQLPEMDMAICSVLEESSVDYVNKFKDLAAQIAPMGTTPKKQESGMDFKY